MKAEIASGIGKPGHVVSENLEVSCGENAIKILEIQRQGKSVQKAKDFLLGSLIKKGSNFNNA